MHCQLCPGYHYSSQWHMMVTLSTKQVIPSQLRWQWMRILAWSFSGSLYCEERSLLSQMNNGASPALNCPPQSTSNLATEPTRPFTPRHCDITSWLVISFYSLPFILIYPIQCPSKSNFKWWKLQNVFTTCRAISLVRTVRTPKEFEKKLKLDLIIVR